MPEDFPDARFDGRIIFYFLPQIYEQKIIFRTAEHISVEAERLAYKAFEAVAPYRALEMAFGHRYHHPRPAGSVARAAIGFNGITENGTPLAEKEVYILF